MPALFNKNRCCIEMYDVGTWQSGGSSLIKTDVVLKFYMLLQFYSYGLV